MTVMNCTPINKGKPVPMLSLFENLAIVRGRSNRTNSSSSEKEGKKSLRKEITDNRVYSRSRSNLINENFQSIGWNSACHSLVEMVRASSI